MTCQLIWSIPNDDAETLLRIRPLREQWEARGPGLLGDLSKTLPWLSLPPKVTVHLMKPRVGGAGRVLSSSELEFEAVLANPWPMLPEVVRLGWLIACAGRMVVDRSAIETFREPSNLQSASTLPFSLAIVPAVLSSAEYVELANLYEPTIDCALANWFQPPEQSISGADLFRWWNELVQEPSIEITERIWQDAVAEL